MRIGIDLGGTKTEGIALDDAGAACARIRRPTPAAGGYDAVLDNVVGIVESLEQQIGARASVGVGTPGSLSARYDTLKNSNTTCLNGRPVKRDLERLLEREVRLENDANCFTLSEAVDGAAKDHDFVFGVIMGTGVGGGVVYQRQLHSGRHHIAGEWGHNVLNSKGNKCYCGRRGCVETFLSGPGLERDWRQHHGRFASAPEIVALADSGDGAAERVMTRFLENYGRALATVINILDPDIVVLGGGMSNIKRLYTEGLEYVTRHVFNDDFETPVVQNIHGDSSGVRGAARLW